MNAKKVLEEIYRAGIAAVDPRMVVSSQAEYIRRKFQDGRFNHIVPIAFGKAACRMAPYFFRHRSNKIRSLHIDRNSARPHDTANRTSCA